MAEGNFTAGNLKVSQTSIRALFVHLFNNIVHKIKLKHTCAHIGCSVKFNSGKN